MDLKSLHTFSGETVTDNTTILLGVKIATKSGLKWIVIHLNWMIVASFLSQAYVMGPSSKFDMYVILIILLKTCWEKQEVCITFVLPWRFLPISFA